jgi:hypothetical protein
LSRFTNKSHLPEQAERICAALMHAEIDLAFAFLRLAMIDSEHDATPRAAELVERAILAHKTVMRHLENMPAELDEEKLELERGAKTLLEAIVSAEREFHILEGSRRIVTDPLGSETSAWSPLAAWRTT